jgi:hypothetical protein
LRQIVYAFVNGNGGRGAQMESSRRLKRELAFEFAKLNGLEQSVDLALDDASTKALATEVRKQAGVCLALLDKYQLSMPSRMRSYSEGKCQHFRDDLKRTEMRFRNAAGEFEGRIFQDRPERPPSGDTRLGDFSGLEEALGSWESDLDDEDDLATPLISQVELSHAFIDIQNDRDIDGLMDLVDDNVEFKLAFDPPLYGKVAVRRQYERDFDDHEGSVVTIREVFETEGKVAIEIHVDSGPPSNVLYDGVIVHHWSDEGRLTHHQLYVDEVTD